MTPPNRTPSSDELAITPRPLPPDRPIIPPPEPVLFSYSRTIVPTLPTDSDPPASSPSDPSSIAPAIVSFAS